MDLLSVAHEVRTVNAPHDGARFQVFLVVTGKVTVFCDVTPFSLIENYQHFRRTYCLILRGIEISPPLTVGQCFCLDTIHLPCNVFVLMSLLLAICTKNCTYPDDRDCCNVFRLFIAIVRENVYTNNIYTFVYICGANTELHRQ
jgi:hypothetical protein